MPSLCWRPCFLDRAVARRDQVDQMGGGFNGSGWSRNVDSRFILEEEMIWKLVAIAAFCILLTVICCFFILGEGEKDGSLDDA